MKKLLCKTLSEFFIFLSDSEVSETTRPLFFASARLLARKAIFSRARVVRALSLGANQQEPLSPFHTLPLKRK